MSQLVFLSGNKYCSGLIRGEQVADFLHAPYNPENVTADDTVVLVKSWNEEVPEHCKKTYVDIIDVDVLFPDIYRHPNVTVIVLTELAKCYAGARLPNEVIVVPQHHCNFEDRRRPDREVKTVGYVGCSIGLYLDKSKLAYELAREGFDFIYQPLNYKEMTRENLVDFLMRIDINIMFRPPMVIPGAPQELKDPLKIVNAMSFGIPSVAFPCPGNLEVQGKYIEARCADDIVRSCKKLRSNWASYQEFKSEGIQFAAKKHISKVAEEYKKLC